MKSPTVRQVDIAKKIGVSQAAVSIVLSGAPSTRVSPELREEIEKAAQRMGYTPNFAARQLKGVKSRLIGVLIGSGAAPVLFERVIALESAALARGYRVLVGQIGRGFEQLGAYVEDFVGRGLDGVVCMSHENKEDPEAVPRLLSRLKNVVYLRKPAMQHGRYVHIDAADCIHQAVDYLLASGRKRIATVILDRFHQANNDRYSAYFEAMRRNKRRPSNSLVWVGGNDLGPNPHEVTNAKADEVVAALVGKASADSIIAINDDWAAQLIKAIKRRGLSVPDDVAVVGQGNFKIAGFFDPEITTLDPRNDLFADAAIDLIVEMIEGKANPKEISRTIKPTLIVRESA